MRENDGVGVMMFTSQRRLLFIACLFIVLPFSASPDDPVEECGRLLSGPGRRDTIYVFCPNFPQLNAEHARDVLIAVLDGTTRISGDTTIFFFRDESVLLRDRWPADRGRLIESWGSAVVGVYHTRSQFLSVRSTTNGEWQTLHLPTTRN